MKVQEILNPLKLKLQVEVIEAEFKVTDKQILKPIQKIIEP